MSSTQSILQDVLRRRRGEFVLGRTEISDVLRQNLAQTEPDTSVLFITGASGSGKTALARALCGVALNENAWVAWTDELHATPLRVMVRWAKHLLGAGAQLPRFYERYQRYQTLAHHIQSDPFYVAGLTDVMSEFTDYYPLRAGGSLETIDRALIDMVAGQSEFHLRYLNRRLQDEEDLELLRSPTALLTRDLIADLNALSQERPLVLVLDSFDQTSGWLDDWLDDLLGPQSTLSRRVRFIIAGQDAPASLTWETRRHLVHYIELEPMDEEAIASLCQRYGILDAEQVDLVHALSDGLPGPAAMLASSYSGKAMGNAGEELIATTLAWIDAAELGALVKLAAIPRAWDTQLLTHLLREGDATSTSLNWLLSRPYLQSVRNQWALIPFARTTVWDYLSRHSPEYLREVHERAIDYHTDALERLAESGSDNWRKGAWILHRIERTYHQLCLQPGEEYAEAAGDLLEVLLFHLPFAARWIDAWRSAGHDTRSETLLEWADLFETCLSRMEAEGWAAFRPLYAQLKTLPDLWPKALGLIYLGEIMAGDGPEGQLQITLDQLSQHIPDEPGPFHLAALVWFRQGNMEAARTACRRALTIDPTYAPAHILLGDTFMVERQPEQAIPSYRAVVEQASDHYAAEPAMFRLGAALVQAGNPEEALENYRLAFRGDPPDRQQAIAYLERGITYHQLGDLDEASGDYMNALGMAGGQAGWAFAIHVSQASARRSRGKYGQALNDCEKGFNWLLERSEVSHASPGKVGLVAAHNNRGNIRLLVDEPEGAIWDYEQAMRRERNSPVLYVNRGLAYLVQRMPPRAEREFDEALQLDPDNALYYFYRGLARAHQERFNEARDDFKRAGQLDPDEALYPHNMGLAYFHRRSLRRAIVAFRQTIEMNPAHANAYYHTGLCYLELGEYERAIAAFDDAVERFEGVERAPAGQPVGALLDRGLSHFRLGNYEEAIRDFEQVHTLINRSRIGASAPLGRAAYRLDQFGFSPSQVPQDAMANERLGEVYAAQGRHVEAVEYFDEALRLAHGDYTEAFTHRGHSYAALKRHQDAILDYREALKRVPTNSGLHIAIGNEYRALSQLENALHAYDRAIQLVPTSGEAYLQMGHVSLVLGYTSRAIDSYRMAELFDQQGTDLYVGRAEALRLRGLHKQALADYDRALRLDPALPKAHWGRARVMWKTGRLKPAVQDTFTAFGFLLRGGLRALAGR